MEPVLSGVEAGRTVGSPANLSSPGSTLSHGDIWPTRLKTKNASTPSASWPLMRSKKRTRGTPACPWGRPPRPIPCGRATCTSTRPTRSGSTATASCSAPVTRRPCCTHCSTSSATTSRWTISSHSASWAAGRRVTRNTTTRRGSKSPRGRSAKASATRWAWRSRRRRSPRPTATAATSSTTTPTSWPATAT